MTLEDWDSDWLAPTLEVTGRSHGAPHRPFKATGAELPGSGRAARLNGDVAMIKATPVLR